MMDKTAKEIMTTDVIVAKQDDSIADVANMLIAEKIGGLPVVDSENRVVGIISETDILKKEKYPTLWEETERKDFWLFNGN